MSLFHNVSCIFFPSCQVPNPSSILYFTLFMPPTHRQTLTDCDTILPLFDIPLSMTQYYFKQFKSTVEGLGTWTHHTRLNEVQQLKNVNKWLRYVKNVYFKKWQNNIHTFSLTRNPLTHLQYKIKYKEIGLHKNLLFLMNKCIFMLVCIDCDKMPFGWDLCYDLVHDKLTWATD